jgi:hypothetical protein
MKKTTWALIAIATFLGIWSIAIGPGITPVGTLKPSTSGYMLRSGATYTEWFNFFGTANTWTTNQNIDVTGDALVIKSSTVTRGTFKADGDETNLAFSSVDLGNDIAGPYVQLGRNSNGTSAGAGHLRLVDKGGTVYYLHVDDDGTLRLGTTAPVGSADTTNSAVGGGSVVGDAKQVSYGPTNTSSGSYASVLNYSSGGGYLESVVCTTQNSDADIAYSGFQCNIRINIDGGGNQDLPDISLDDLFSADDVMMGYDDSSNDAYSGRRIFLHARFESSCVVSVMQNSGGTIPVGGVVHYTTDQ